MSKLFDKFLTKMLAVIVIIVFIIGFREMILTDDDTATAFGALMGMLPFAEVVTDVICKILRYQYEIPVISTASVWTDLIRLALMACLQPIIVGLLTAMFLPLPAGMDSYEREVYMDSFRYRAKELLLTIISAPLLALVASWFSAFLFDLFISTFGTPGSILLGALSVIGLSAVSLGAVAGHRHCCRNRDCVAAAGDFRLKNGHDICNRRSLSGGLCRDPGRHSRTHCHLHCGSGGLAHYHGLGCKRPSACRCGYSQEEFDQRPYIAVSVIA